MNGFMVECMPISKTSKKFGKVRVRVRVRVRVKS